MTVQLTRAHFEQLALETWLRNISPDSHPSVLSVLRKFENEMSLNPYTLLFDARRKQDTEEIDKTLQAFMDEYWTSKVNSRPEHIRDIRFDGTVHNNKMERMNGEIRDREKVMRGLERKDSPILTGYQLFHNYIRPHKALGGQTPADKAGIIVKGENKWLTLIQHASEKRA